ncbi:MAG: 50S ribosomal protein L23 [Deltaproteobacteria bacterium]|nr:50S ribosomal protein L23 [Deltaproteobacteria bacterium]
MKALDRVLLRPLILTEKGNRMREDQSTYLFEVAAEATKVEIRQAVEKLFEVKVRAVHTMIVRGKPARLGRRRLTKPSWKKAIVTLAEGSKIEYFETV